jgi:hypothetical protein
MQIIQIVPRLPPSVDGVGDYAYLLARQLRAAHGIQTHFVVCDPQWGKAEIGKAENINWESTSPRPSPQSGEGALPSTLNSQPSTNLDGFPMHQLKERSAEELLRVLSQPGMPATVLLQYVGYGYQKRGCPVWLVRGLEKWRKQKVESKNLGAESSGQKPESRKKKVEIKKNEGGDKFQLSQFPISALSNLVTMFHELYARGPVWQSVFWTSPVQRWVAKSLAQMSSHCFTNLTVNALALRQMTARDKNNFTVLPVFSNVGEPEALPDWNQRQPRMIVFGSASQRRKVYFKHQADLEKACRVMGINELVDIGAPFEIPPLAVPVSRRGILSASEVSREMLSARAGFFAYPAAYLGKSGVFAAYAAHGLAPITFAANVMRNADGLACGEHYLSMNDLVSRTTQEIGKIGTRVQYWYQEHCAKNQAIFYADICQDFIGNLKGQQRPANL